MIAEGGCDGRDYYAGSLAVPVEEVVVMMMMALNHHGCSPAESTKQSIIGGSRLFICFFLLFLVLVRFNGNLSSLRSGELFHRVKERK